MGNTFKKTTGETLSIDDLFGWLEARRREVSSMRHWVPNVRWLSPNCSIGLAIATAVGLDGEDYEWMRLYVVEYSDGLVASIRQFELDDEEAAFAYADTLVTPQASRLAIANRASEMWPAGITALWARDVDGFLRLFSDNYVYDDRRRMGGN